MNIKKKLPIGLSTLEGMISDNYTYVDKTRLINELVSGKYYFLSRPRRFGKSLLLDTLKQAYLGNKKIFKGLYLEHHWDWNTQYPVIHVGFAMSSAIESGAVLRDIITAQLSAHATLYNIILPDRTYETQFDYLIKSIAEQSVSKKVVILIDEYDKPILDVIDQPESAYHNREILKSFYGVIKDNDAHLQFVFLTGVSKFSKVGLFSGLNNLNDISLDAKYADICGYTQAELENTFSDYLTAGNVDKAMLKLWYNGYNFAGTEIQKVYNPFDILLFFDKGFQYRSFWFETGNPAFLIKLIQRYHYYFPEMEEVHISENSLSTFEIDDIPLPTLLFQTGYLTIKAETMIGAMRGYVLSYPNLEVKASLNNALARMGTTTLLQSANMNKLVACLAKKDLQGLGEVFHGYFSSIPHDWYRNNDIQHYEGFYASIVYSYFCALGYKTIAEDATNVGKIDLTIELPDKILILEFKLKKNGDAISALQQIKDRHYARS